MAAIRVLVIGSTGFLGPWVVAELRRRGATVLTASRSSAERPVDLAEPQQLQRLCAEVAADAVVDLAAMSRLQDCAANPATAHALNAVAPGELARHFGSRFVHVSTDLVFDGAGAPYAPLDPVGPLSVYGATKAEGEERVLAAGGSIVRLPLLFGPDAMGRGATAMLRAAIGARRPVCLFTNEYRTPLHAADAAAGLCDLVFAARRQRRAHLPGPERVSRWELGLRFCAVHGLPADLVQPGECQDATRPRDVALAGDWQARRGLDAMLAAS
jgi:dTDP-4-dehydrorhamnose reductase